MNIINRLNQNPGRPIQVTIAVYLLFGYLAVSLLVYAVQSVILVFNLPDLYTMGYFFFDRLIYLFAYLLNIYITVKIASGSNWARWVLLFGFAFILLVSTCRMNVIISSDPITGIVILSQVLVSAVAVALLFQRPSSLWFTNGEVQEDPRSEDEVIERISDPQPATTEEKDEAPPPKSIKYWLIISQVIFVLLLVPWFLVLLAGQAAETDWQVALVFIIFAHPITAIVCGIVSWFLYANHRFKWAAIVTSIPLIPFIIFFFLMFFYELQSLI